jgi:DNA mismatch endonuclease Vsr
MADVHDKATRRYNMSRIKGKNTKPEMLVRRFLHANGYRYRLHDKKLPVKPDIVYNILQEMYRRYIFLTEIFNYPVRNFLRIINHMLTICYFTNQYMMSARIIKQIGSIR